jgi:hypothetical protein
MKTIVIITCSIIWQSIDHNNRKPAVLLLLFDLRGDQKKVCFTSTSYGNEGIGTRYQQANRTVSVQRDESPRFPKEKDGPAFHRCPVQRRLEKSRVSSERSMELFLSTAAQYGGASPPAKTCPSFDSSHPPSLFLSSRRNTENWSCRRPELLAGQPAKIRKLVNWAHVASFVYSWVMSTPRPAPAAPNGPQTTRNALVPCTGHLVHVWTIDFHLVALRFALVKNFHMHMVQCLPYTSTLSFCLVHEFNL